MGIIDNTIKALMRRVGYAPVQNTVKSWGTHGYGYNNTNSTYETTRNEYGYAQSYANVSAVFRSVELITNAIDQLDYTLIAGHGDNEVLISTSYDMDSQFNRALRHHRKRYGRDLISLIVISNLLYDNTYIELLDNEYNIPSGFRWLNPLWVSLQRYDSNPDNFYFWYSGNNETVTLSRNEVAYDFGYNPFDDFQGMSRVLPVLDNADIDVKLKEFTQSFFRNGAFMAGILTPVDSGLGTVTAQSQPDNIVLQKQITDWLRGSKNAFRLFMPHKPVEFQQLTPPNIDQYYGIQDPIQREIFRVFGIPLELAGGDETRFKFGDDVYNAFMMLTIMPMVKRVERIINDDLLPFLIGDDTTRLEFDTSQFDSATEAHERQANIVNTQIQGTLITLNEGRLQQGFETDDALDGLYMVRGVPVPKSELGNLWRYEFGVFEPQGDSSVTANANDTMQTYAVKVPERYAHIDFKPTQGMVDEAKRGLAWRDEYGRGGTNVGVARARDIANGRNLSPETINRMVSFFARHAGNATAEGFNRGEDGYPSNGRIAWALWGGDAGQSWALARQSQMETADAKKNSDHIHDETCEHDHVHEISYSDDTQHAINELKTWRKVALKSHTRNYTPDHPLLAKYTTVINADIVASGGEKSIVTETIDWYQNELKRHDTLPLYKSLLTFRREFRRWLREAWLGSTNGVWFQIDSSETISKEYRRAFNRGWKESGRALSEITDADNALWEAQVREDTRYLNELFTYVQDNSRANGGKWRDVSKRGDSWLSRYDELYAIGQTAGARDKKLMWRINHAKENCKDCLRLQGRVYYGKMWLEYGIRPQSAKLACFGIHCGCEFVEVPDANVTTGRPPKIG